MKANARARDKDGRTAISRSLDRPVGDSQFAAASSAFRLPARQDRRS